MPHELADNLQNWGNQHMMISDNWYETNSGVKPEIKTV